MILCAWRANGVVFQAGLTGNEMMHIRFNSTLPAADASTMLHGVVALAERYFRLPTERIRATWSELWSIDRVGRWVFGASTWAPRAGAGQIMRWDDSITWVTDGTSVGFSFSTVDLAFPPGFVPGEPREAPMNWFSHMTGDDVSGEGE
jgi:hypothetical protein